MPKFESVKAELTLHTKEGSQTYDIHLHPVDEETFYYRDESAGFRLILESLDPKPLSSSLSRTDESGSSRSGERTSASSDPKLAESSKRLLPFLPLKKRDVKEDVKKIMSKYGEK